MVRPLLVGSRPLSKISDDVGLLQKLDVGGVYREAARRTRFTAEDEIRTAESNHLFMQPTLDETWVRLQGGLDGYSASLVDKTLTGLADKHEIDRTLTEDLVSDGAFRRPGVLGFGRHS